MGEKGKAMAWVFRKPCPKCKTLMKKPKKTSLTYDCPKCGYNEPKAEYEAAAVVNIEYVCPECSHAGETTSEFKRKTLQGVKSFIFVCEACKTKLGITKKMKVPKPKKKK
ncbi:hypothetical protein GOV07_00910 [Candidatus Woesearchaeota archaeon]|nr:hypothetical protein [Candidatus Woesearchaeota archaeon]